MKIKASPAVDQGMDIKCSLHLRLVFATLLLLTIRGVFSTEDKTQSKSDNLKDSDQAIRDKRSIYDAQSKRAWEGLHFMDDINGKRRWETYMPNKRSWEGMYFGNGLPGKRYWEDMKFLQNQLKRSWEGLYGTGKRSWEALRFNNKRKSKAVKDINDLKDLQVHQDENEILQNDKNNNNVLDSVVPGRSYTSKEKNQNVSEKNGWEGMDFRLDLAVDDAKPKPDKKSWEGLQFHYKRSNHRQPQLSISGDPSLMVSKRSWEPLDVCTCCHINGNLMCCISCSKQSNREDPKPRVTTKSTHGMLFVLDTICKCCSVSAMKDCCELCAVLSDK